MVLRGLLFYFFLFDFSAVQSECLTNQARNIAELKFPDKLPGEIFDADTQCKWQFGKHSKQCQFTRGQDICENLWCYRDTAMCETKFLPAAEGTSCGYGMVGRHMLGMFVCMAVCLLTLSALQTRPDICANSVGPDEMAHDEPSHRDLNCLPFCFSFWPASLFAIMDMSKFNDGEVHSINTGWKGFNTTLKVPRNFLH